MNLISSVLKAALLCLSFLWLNGCTTIDNFLGGDENEPVNMAEADNPDMAEPVVVIDPQQQVADQQAERITRVENALSQILLQQRSLAAEMEAVKVEKAENVKVQAEILTAETNQDMRSGNDQPAGGFAIHLASYELESSIEPGWQEIADALPEDMRNKQVRIASATIAGKVFYRLLLGSYDTRAEANDACVALSSLLNYCDVMTFRGYVFK